MSKVGTVCGSRKDERAEGHVAPLHKRDTAGSALCLVSGHPQCKKIDTVREVCVGVRFCAAASLKRPCRARASPRSVCTDVLGSRLWRYLRETIRPLGLWQRVKYDRWYTCGSKTTTMTNFASRSFLMSFRRDEREEVMNHNGPPTSRTAAASYRH